MRPDSLFPQHLTDTIQEFQVLFERIITIKAFQKRDDFFFCNDLNDASVQSFFAVSNIIPSVASIRSRI